MTAKEKQSASPTPESGGNAAQHSRGDDSWRQWKVKPDLAAIFFMLPEPKAVEAGIGKRIAYCRGQLDNLSVEALSRYTKYFDSAGISKASLVRYEAGDSLPGARELRILCDTLWVPSQWLLYGSVDPNSQNKAATALLDAITDFVRQETLGGTVLEMFGSSRDVKEKMENQEVEQRQRWIDEARKPSQR